MTGASWPIEVRVRDEAGVARAGELVAGGVPLAPGMLRPETELRVRAADGGERRVQARARERWPDGSVRWLSTAFLADVPRQGESVYLLEPEPATVAAEAPAAAASESPEGIRIDTGAVSFLVRRAPFGSLAGYPGVDSLTLAVRDADGVEHTAVLDEDGLRVLDAGPVVVRVIATGTFRAPAGGAFLDFELEVEAVAGSAEVALDCRIVNREPGTSATLSEWVARISGAGSEAACCGVFEQVHRSRSPFALRQDGGGHTKGIFVVARVDSAAGDWEDASDPEYRRRWEWAELQGRQGTGWLDVEAVGGVRLAVVLPRFADDNPTSLAWDGEAVEAGLWPGEAGELELTQGVAVTRRLVLAAHRGEAVDASRLAARAAAPLLPETGELAFETGAAPEVLRRRPERHPTLESYVRGELFSWCLAGQATGLVDRGDCLQVPLGPRAGFTANNEHDAIFALCLHYLRSGERAYLDSAESYADHVVDVDVIHHSDRNDFEAGGVRAHGVNHVHYVPARTDAGEVATSLDTGHMWVEGLLLTSALCGRERYAEAARGIGECLLRLEEIGWTRPEPGPRNAGWPLVALAALHRSTGEQRWLDAARRIGLKAAEAQGADGRWTMRLGFWDGYCAWQNCVLLTGLARLLEVDPDPPAALEPAFRAGVDALLELGRYDDGGFVYLDRSDYRWVSRTGLILEALAAAYELTGEERFLVAGLEGGSAWFRPAAAGTASSNDVAEWRGHLRFLAALDRAGLLADLGADHLPAPTF